MCTHQHEVKEHARIVVQISLQGAQVATRARAVERWQYQKGWEGEAEPKEGCGLHSLSPISQRDKVEEDIVLEAEL